MRITLAQAMGTCFGVQDAIDLALQPEFAGRLTIVGQLVHNPQTMERLRANGVQVIERDQIASIATEAVMITAHGASDQTKADLRARGLVVYDATCPLVIRLHKLARFLEREGYAPVVIGDPQHVEVRGVVGNLKTAVVINAVDEVGILAGTPRIGVVSQTTNRLAKVERIVAAIRALPGVRETRFVDTICQPVKERQQAIVDLLGLDIDLAIVIGGRNSANTHKLWEMCRDKGVAAHHIECAEDLDPAWFAGHGHCGITAGTSTPQDVIESVVGRIRTMAA
jgi:4-hydroxy-3-methylbut-2-en-1-yl diphosphate reductase